MIMKYTTRKSNELDSSIVIQFYNIFVNHMVIPLVGVLCLRVGISVLAQHAALETKNVWLPIRRFWTPRNVPQGVRSSTDERTKNNECNGSTQWRWIIWDFSQFQLIYSIKTYWITFSHQIPDLIWISSGISPLAFLSELFTSIDCPHKEIHR